MRLLLAFAIVHGVWLAGPAHAQPQYDLHADGLPFLVREARGASAFLLGELHGSREIPALLEALWPPLVADGYTHVAAEVSDWAAGRLERGDDIRRSLWRREEAAIFTGGDRRRRGVLWGCDIEEGDPAGYIAALADRSREPRLRALAEAVRGGYRRADAPTLLPAAAGLRAQPTLLATLEVEAARAQARRYEASTLRETFMKTAFLAHRRAAGRRAGKVLARFGRNHLHRGLDRRGVSTFGNFLAEVALQDGSHTFHVAAFAGGGQVRLAVGLADADERGDDPAFAWLAGTARFPATVFDLRPLRTELRRVPVAERTAAQTSLLYWADSYDAIVYYRSVTPLAQ